MSKVAILGAGSWGTAFSIVLADANNDVTMWARREAITQAINDQHENTDYLPGVRLPDTVTATCDPERALEGAEFVILAVPSQTLRASLSLCSEAIPQYAVVVSLIKGVELGTLQRMSEVISDVTGADRARVGVLSGPNLAPEISQRQPAASVVACADEENAKRLRGLCHSPTFRPYSSTDVVGCELGGAYKNVVALSIGMAIGLGYGESTVASLLTRGLAGTAELAAHLGADPLTLMGLAGLGDLVASCASPLARNRALGEKIGQGLSIEEITRSTRQVAEGSASCASLKALAKKAGVHAPIAEGVDTVISGSGNVGDVVIELVSMTPR